MLSLLKTSLIGCVGLCALTAASIGPAAADAIPYGGSGQNPAVYTFTAARTGNLTAYFYGTGASFNETLGLFEGANFVTPVASGVFPNHSTPVGTSYDFGTVTAGTLLTFFIDVQQAGGYRLYSNPALNPGGTQQVYSAAYTGGVAGIPAGTYVGFEDLNPTINGGSDFNYTDEQFVFTNTAFSVPLPASAPMFGAALLALSAAGYGLKRKKAAAAG